MPRLSMSDIYLVSYDITSNKLRRKIEKTLKNYGFRIQYSIFQCIGDKEKMAGVLDALGGVLKTHERYVTDSDSIIVIGGIGEGKMSYILGEEHQNLAQYLIY